MISYFKTTNAFSSVCLAFILILLRLRLLLHMDNQPHSDFIGYVSKFLPSAFLQPVNIALAAIMVYTQALLLNYVVNNHHLFKASTTLPALVYLTVSSLFGSFLLVSQELVCNFLVLYMLDKILDLRKLEKAQSIAFDLGIVIAVGTLIYVPFIAMFLALWIALAIFRPFNWREWLAGLLGFMAICFLVTVLYYWNNQLDQLQLIWLPFYRTTSSMHYDLPSLVPVMLILVLGVVQLRKNFFKSYVQTRKLFQLMLAFIVAIGLLTIYMKTDFFLMCLMLCFLPVVLVVSYYFSYATKRWAYESLYVLLLLSVLYLQWNCC